MAESTDVREWAREKGLEVKERGRVPDAVHQAYAAAHPESGGDGDYTGPDRAGPGEPDYDQGVTDDDFITADDPPDDPEPGMAPDGARMDTAERAPRRVARQRAAGKSFRERVWGGGKAPAKRPAKKHPRVSLKGFAEDMFLDLAWTFQGLPPMEKILYLQAPLAGTVVEDAVRNTALDHLLQPAARFDRQFKALEALSAPAWVMAIMARGRKDETGEYSPETKLMFSGLRHALLSMTRVTDVNFGELKAKSEDLRSASGDIDAMIAWLFEMPQLTEEQVQAMGRDQANGQAAPAS